MNRQELFHGDFHLQSAALYWTLGIQSQTLLEFASLENDEKAASIVSRAEQGYRGASMIIPFPFVTIRNTHCRTDISSCGKSNALDCDIFTSI